VRFFVPQAELSRFPLGGKVEVRCDGCGGTIPASVTHRATEAEFTPPVIYSNTMRSKLVFMIEAHPSPDDAPRLHPGQPVEIRAP
jgi:HlyD family secretion protein